MILSGFPRHSTADFLVMAALRMPDVAGAMARALACANQPDHRIHAMSALCVEGP